MRKVILFSVALVVIMDLPALGHAGMPDVQYEKLQFKPGFTYEIRYTPIATDKIASITFTIVGEIKTLGMREIITGVTPKGETWHLPVDLILDIREIPPEEPSGAETPQLKRS